MAFHPSVYPLCTAMANEWREMRHHLEHLAASLCADEHFAARHIDRLQLFDALAQQADESAAMLDRLSEGMCSTDALGLVRLDLLQQRLRQVLGELT
ncbi:MAG: hypothetical protein KA533_05630 [Sphingobium sp.]|nr:hypothetical protein [Sphingobium sp.]MBP6111609.1 hypothetical protein [Sphingobium sp.]MBP8670942.1 hypothetical protein [Sphingobium sp.]MBP9158091.1 hypothetical protein [Sphingobium sp.]